VCVDFSALEEKLRKIGKKPMSRLVSCPVALLVLVTTRVLVTPARKTSLSWASGRNGFILVEMLGDV
jgi:hypothetical protein